MVDTLLSLDDTYFLAAAACLTALFLFVRLLKRVKPATDIPIDTLSETATTPEPLLSKEEAFVDEVSGAPGHKTVDTAKDDDAEFAPEHASLQATASVEERLTKTRTSFFGTLRDLFRSAPTLSVDTLEELQYLLVSSDLGIKTATRLIDALKQSLSKGEVVDQDTLLTKLKEQVLAELQTNVACQLESIGSERTSPRICLIVGVNGVGKTTTTAKLASRAQAAGAKVLLVAADTFRAAAVEQLQTWGARLNIPVVAGAPDAKPQTVVFDAMKRAQEEPFDLILIDTAGRLNNKSNLMQELAGIKNAVERHHQHGVDEVLLVVDGTTGQNAVAQAKEFHSVVQLTGLIVTKLDGSPKGGVVVAVKEAIDVPVRYIGVGESAADLRPFVAQEFVDALFAREEKTLEQESAHAATRRRKRKEAA